MRIILCPDESTVTMTTTVILSNRLDRVRSVFKKTKGAIHWMLLAETDSTMSIAGYLRTWSSDSELDIAQLFRERRKEFQRCYVESMSNLSHANRSLRWWALPPSTKDPKYTRLCWDSASFLLITEMIQAHGGTLVVLTDSTNLKCQVAWWSKQKGVVCKSFIKNQRPWRNLIKLYTPAPLIKAFSVCVYRWILTSKLSLDTCERTVIVSQTYPSSFRVDDQLGYKDAYFGPLLDHLKDSGERAIIFGIIRGPFAFQNKMIKTVDDRLPVVPIEAFLTFWDIIWSTVQALWITLVGIHIVGRFIVGEEDLTRLLRLEFRNEYRSGNPFINLSFFRASSRLAKNLHITRCIYPFENRPWEKMLLIAMRSHSPITRLVGYQHAAINSGFLHYFLGKGEADISPLPDVLLTTGGVMTEWLEQYGGYNPGMIKSACALRRRSNSGIVGETNNARTHQRLLVALGFPDLENYNRVLSIVRDAVSPNYSWDIVVRPHPNNPESLFVATKAIASTGIKIESLRSGDLAAELEETTAVMYVASTVALESASAGLPTICLDTGKALETDPMGDWDEFKWSVYDSDSLKKALADIMSISQERFNTMSHQASVFGHSYLTPVTSAGMQIFLEA